MITRPVPEGQEDPVAGVYCFPRPAVRACGGVGDGIAELVGPTIATVTHGQLTGCPTGTQMAVKLYMIQEGNWAGVNGSFNIVFWP